MNRPSDETSEHVAVYDYGMGGIWVLIAANSAELIERRYPGLRVVSVGDPEWVTTEKYSEILNSWIPASLHFDLGNPTGWLRDSDDALSCRSDPSS